MTLGGNGRFSGHLTMGPAMYTFSSSFQPNGTANGIIAKYGKKQLSLNLQVDVTGLTGPSPWRCLQRHVGLCNYRVIWRPMDGKKSLAVDGALQNCGVAKSAVQRMSPGYYGSLTRDHGGCFECGYQFARMVDEWSRPFPFRKAGQWPTLRFCPQAGEMCFFGWVSFQPKLLKREQYNGDEYLE